MDWQNKEEVKKRIQKIMEEYWYLFAASLVVLGVLLVVLGILRLAR